MLKNVDEKLLGLNGKIAIENGKEILISQIIVDALMDSSIGSQTVTGQQKMERYNLAREVQKGGLIEFKAEDLALLKELVGIKYTPLVVGQFYPWVDSDNVEKPKLNKVQSA
jgi:hypothetical protein